MIERVLKATAVRRKPNDSLRARLLDFCQVRKGGPMRQVSLFLLAKFSVLMIVAFLGVWPALAKASILTNTNDSGPGSLRDAIASAAPGDTINFGVTGM